MPFTLFLPKIENYKKALHYFQKGLTTLPIQFKDSLPHSNPSLAMLKLVANDYIISTLLTNKGEAFLELYKQEQDKQYLRDALTTFKTADKAIDQMRWAQNTVQSKLFWREKTKKMYENAIETCYLLQDIEHAFFFFEKSRAVLLNDKLSELGAQKYLSKAELQREQELRIKLFSLWQRLISLKESNKQYRQVSLQVFATQELIEKFIKNLEKSKPAYYQYKYDTAIYTVPEVRSKLLEKDQSFITYFTGYDHLYILAIKPDTTLLIQHDEKKYSAISKELLILCADKTQINQNYSRYSHLALELHDHIFHPLSIKTKRVIVSPDDHFVPFEILLTDKKNPGSFLLKRHAFSYTYSAGYLLKSDQDKKSNHHSFLGIAPVQYKSYLKQQPLTGADFSLENISVHFSTSNFHIREAATKKEFLKSLPGHSLVHLYSHAEADRTGKEPVLYFQDSVLHVSELQLLGEL